MQLSGELSAMMAERSDVSGALLAMLYGRPEEDAGVFTRKASRVRDLTVASAASVNVCPVTGDAPTRIGASPLRPRTVHLRS
jgi:hypothetical protein